METEAPYSNQFHVIISTMRSGTSLCGHLLAEAGWIWYAGETHTHLSDEKGVQVSRKEIQKNGNGTNIRAPLCDKILAPRALPDGGRFLVERADRIYIIIRHPLAVWYSGKKMKWDFFQLDGLLAQFVRVREITEVALKSKLCVLSYYDLTNHWIRKKLFGKDLNTYSLNPKTGEPNWGDFGSLIRSGSIRETTLKDDLRKALRAVWMDLDSPHFQRAMIEYRAILRWVGREDLDIDFPEEVFDGIKGLRIEHGMVSQEEDYLALSVEELKGLTTLPIEDGMLEWIWSEDLAHSCKPGELVMIAIELHRLLAPNGCLRLSTLDLDQVLRRGLAWPGDGSEENNHQRARISPGNLGRAEAVNHCFGSEERKFIYDVNSLKEVMKAAGFYEIRVVPVKEGESRELATESLLSGEQFILEGRKQH
jgi:hypothetical protein